MTRCAFRAVLPRYHAATSPCHADAYATPLALIHASVLYRRPRLRLMPPLLRAMPLESLLMSPPPFMPPPSSLCRRA